MPNIKTFPTSTALPAGSDAVPGITGQPAVPLTRRVDTLAPLYGGGALDHDLTLGIDTSGFGDVFKNLPNIFTKLNQFWSNTLFRGSVQISGNLLAYGRVYGGGNLNLDGNQAGGTAAVSLVGNNIINSAVPTRVVLATVPIYQGSILSVTGADRYITSGELQPGGIAPPTPTEGVFLIDEQLTTVSTSGTAQTIVYSHVIPGGTLDTNNALRLQMSARYHAGGASHTRAICVLYGGTVLFSGTDGASNSQTGGEQLDCYLAAAGATLQTAHTQWTRAGNAATAAGTYGDTDNVEAVQRWARVNSAQDQTLIVSYASNSYQGIDDVPTVILEELSTGEQGDYFLDRAIDQVVIADTTETIVYSGSVPAGLLGTSNALRLKLIGSHTSPSAGAIGFGLRATYGGFTVFSGGGSFNVATDCGIAHDLTLSAFGSATKQVAHGRLQVGMDASNITASGQATGGFAQEAVQRWANIDSAQAQPLLISLKHAATPGETRIHGVYVEALTPGSSNGCSLLNSSFPNITVSGTNTTVYSYTVPGGTLGTNHGLRWKLIGSLDKQATGNLIPSITYGGTQIAGGAVGMLAATDTDQHFTLDGTLMAQNTDAAQVGASRLTLGSVATASGIAGAITMASCLNTLSIDSAQDRAFSISLYASNFATKARVYAILLERLKPQGETLAGSVVGDTQVSGCLLVYDCLDVRGESRLRDVQISGTLLVYEQFEFGPKANPSTGYSSAPGVLMTYPADQFGYTAKLIGSGINFGSQWFYGHKSPPNSDTVVFGSLGGGVQLLSTDLQVSGTLLAYRAIRGTTSLDLDGDNAPVTQVTLVGLNQVNSNVPARVILATTPIYQGNILTVDGADRYVTSGELQPGTALASTGDLQVTGMLLAYDSSVFGGTRANTYGYQTVTGGKTGVLIFNTPDAAGKTLVVNGDATFFGSQAFSGYPQSGNTNVAFFDMLGGGVVITQGTPLYVYNNMFTFGDVQISGGVNIVYNPTRFRTATAFPDVQVTGMLIAYRSSQFGAATESSYGYDTPQGVLINWPPDPSGFGFVLVGSGISFGSQWFQGHTTTNKDTASFVNYGGGVRLIDTPLSTNQNVQVSGSMFIAYGSSQFGAATESSYGYDTPQGFLINWPPDPSGFVSVLVGSGISFGSQWFQSHALTNKDTVSFVNYRGGVRLIDTPLRTDNNVQISGMLIAYGSSQFGAATESSYGYDTPQGMLINWPPDPSGFVSVLVGSGISFGSQWFQSHALTNKDTVSFVNYRGGIRLIDTPLKTDNNVQVSGSMFIAYGSSQFGAATESNYGYDTPQGVLINWPPDPSGFGFVLVGSGISFGSQWFQGHTNPNTDTLMFVNFGVGARFIDTPIITMGDVQISGLLSTYQGASFGAIKKRPTTFDAPQGVVVSWPPDSTGYVLSVVGSGEHFGTQWFSAHTLTNSDFVYFFNLAGGVRTGAVTPLITFGDVQLSGAVNVVYNALFAQGAATGPNRYITSGELAAIAAAHGWA